MNNLLETLALAVSEECSVLWKLTPPVPPLIVEEEDIFLTLEDIFFSLWLIWVEAPVPGNLMAEKLLRGPAVARLSPSLPRVDTRLGLLRPLSLKSGKSNISVPSGDVTDVGIVVRESGHSSIFISSLEGRS